MKKGGVVFEFGRNIFYFAVVASVAGCASGGYSESSIATSTGASIENSSLMSFCDQVGDLSREIMRARYDRSTKDQVLGALYTASKQVENMPSSEGIQDWASAVVDAAYSLPKNQIGPAAYSEQMKAMCLESGDANDPLSRDHLDKLPTSSEIIERHNENYAARQESAIEMAERIQSSARERDKANAKWNTRITPEIIDDSSTVVISLPSIDRVWNFNAVRKHQPAMIFLQCSHNQTSLYFAFNGNIMADHGAYQRVTMRIDGGEPFTMNMKSSNSKTAIGLWGGALSIPLIKRLFGKDELIVQATPFAQSSVTVSFRVSGIADEILPLRQECGW